jgi:hypothetical protein
MDSMTRDVKFSQAGQDDNSASPKHFHLEGYYFTKLSITGLARMGHS